MRSVKARFESLKKEGWSSYYQFCMTISGQKFTQKAVREWFNRLVEKDDYVRSEKDAILQHLYSL